LEYFTPEFAPSTAEYAHYQCPVKVRQWDCRFKTATPPTTTINDR